MIIILDKNLVKNLLDEDKICELLQELGSNRPFPRHEALVCETICHNHPGEGSHKLYYYPNTKLFKCYTNCGEAFDIFDLIVKSNAIRGIKLEMFQAVQWVWSRLDNKGFTGQKSQIQSEDWDILNRYAQIRSIQTLEKQELKEYPASVLDRLPFFIIDDWQKEGISVRTMQHFGIKYNPVTNAIIIPHYDEKNRLIGIRQRTLVKEDEEIWGKYRPAVINGEMYNHPLSHAFYGLNWNYPNIKRAKKAIIFEGEKSVMLFDSVFSKENNISLACCGSNISQRQVDILVDLGVEEMIVAFDKEFLNVGDEGFNVQTQNLKNIYKKHSSRLTISFVFDKQGFLKLKESPIERGRDVFMKLYEKRFTLGEK